LKGESKVPCETVNPDRLLFPFRAGGLKVTKYGLGSPFWEMTIIVTIVGEPPGGFNPIG
jgi:hypothetical protein